MLQEAKVPRIQVDSFVHPQRVPQMADTDALVRQLIRTSGVLLTGLVLNEQGLERALACGLSHVCMSVSASDSHSRKNARRSAEEALAEMTGLISQAKRANLKVRGGIQCAFGCVYEGRLGKRRCWRWRRPWRQPGPMK